MGRVRAMLNRSNEVNAMLMSHEREKLAHYILQMDEERARILAAAIADWQTSGPLIQAYRAVEALI